jgi:S1-C subfamily serine protease
MQKHRFGTSQGSGFLITADGYAVTNNHVVNGSAMAEIKLDDGKIYKARVVGTDTTSDLALMRPSAQRGSAPAGLPQDSCLGNRCYSLALPREHWFGTPS